MRYAHAAVDRTITLSHATLLPHISGALVWQETATLIVSDLHFEKASASFAARGRHLPPYDTRVTLKRLAALVDPLCAARVICLGDSFHDNDAPERMSDKDAGDLRALTDRANWIWVGGNHDAHLPHGFGGRIVDEFEADGLRFRHALRIGETGIEISGHFHPKATVPARGRPVTRPCFVFDAHRVVLPAFSAFTGGLNVGDAAFAPHFPRGFNLAVLGDAALTLVLVGGCPLIADLEQTPSASYQLRRIEQDFCRASRVR